MAATSNPSSREELIDYCLRKLGYPVIEINVDRQQCLDRVEDALQLFSEYHFDGVEKLYLKYQVTATDITNGYIDLVSTNTGLSSAERTQAATESGVTSSFNIDNRIVSVTRVWNVSRQSVGMFDLRYQYALNDLYAFGSLDLINYDLTKQYLTLLQQFLSPEKAVRFSKVTNRLYIDTNWKENINAGSFIIIECYGILNPTVYTEIYNDRLLKKYLTSLIKQQWGQNLMKYGNMKLPGGSILNGTDIYMEGKKECETIEENIQSMYEGPPEFFTL